MKFAMRFVLTLVLLHFSIDAKDVSASPPLNEVRSEYFVIHTSAQAGPSPGKVLSLCEELRSELCRVWGLTDRARKWDPLCEIVVHPSAASYLASVGPEAAQTRGCSRIELDNGKVSRRRIDLQMDADGSLSALAHELTHVVLADRFHGKPPAHWLDEGIATLADSRAKQLLHERDCQDALSSGHALPLQQLLNLEEFTSPAQMPAFYGQSLSLVSMLARQRTPQQLIDFAVDARDSGYPFALKKHYGINSVAELDFIWRAHAKASRHVGPSSPLLIASLRP